MSCSLLYSLQHVHLGQLIRLCVNWHTLKPVLMYPMLLHNVST